MSRSVMTDLQAQGPLPAGMMRIRLGTQERYVWPVHLPGWLAVGWKVAGTGTAAPAAVPAAAELLEPVTSSVIEQPAAEDDAKPALPRGRRGRRRKEELVPAAAVDVVTPAEQEPQPEAPPAEPEHVIDDGAALADGVADDTEPSQPAAENEAHAEHDAEPELNLAALPDDLFDDQLI